MFELLFLVRFDINILELGFHLGVHELVERLSHLFLVFLWLRVVKGLKEGDLRFLHRVFYRAEPRLLHLTALIF